MKRLVISVCCVLSLACATGGVLLTGQQKAERAAQLAIAFQQSWDEACTVGWLRCDVSAFADEAVGVYVETVHAHPEQWQSAFDATIESIKSRAMIADLLGRWVFWLDVAKFAVDNLDRAT